MPSKDPEKIKATQKRYLEKNGDAVRARKREAYLRNRDKERARQIKYQQENRETIYAYNRTWIRNYRSKIKEELFKAYGGQCACCGESEPKFLELDHINNDGASERRKHGNQFVEWISLKKSGYPKTRHQLLCANCNTGKQRNGGVCPHKRKDLS